MPSIGDGPHKPFSPSPTSQSDTAVTELHLGADEQVGSTREGSFDLVLDHLLSGCP